jgi:hypothetical protein
VLNKIVEGIDPVDYFRARGFNAFEWQKRVFEYSPRTILLCARQSGKSEVISAKICHKAKYKDKTLNIIVAPAKQQSTEDMKKIEGFIGRDRDFPEMVHDAVYEKELTNRSRIVALPGSERSVRGYSSPSTIIVDEASRVLDETYKAVRPMMVGANTELILLSTAFGKRGFFFNAWTHSERYRKILVVPAYTIEGNKIVDAPPEEEFKKYWAKKGVEAYYSPRHTKEFLEEELEDNGELYVRQEYLCEFLDVENAIFRYDDILRAFNEPIEQIDGEETGALITDEVEAIEVM